MKPFKAIFGIFAFMLIFHVVGYSKSHDAQTTEKTESVCNFDNQLATMEVDAVVGNVEVSTSVTNPYLIVSPAYAVVDQPSGSGFKIRVIQSLVDKGSTLKKIFKHRFVNLRNKVGWRTPEICNC